MSEERVFGRYGTLIRLVLHALDGVHASNVCASAHH